MFERMANMIEMLIGIIVAFIIVSIILWAVVEIMEDRIDKEHFDSQMNYFERTFDLDEKDNGFFDK